MSEHSKRKIDGRASLAEALPGNEFGGLATAALVGLDANEQG